MKGGRTRPPTAVPLSRFILFSLTVLKRKDVLIQYNQEKMKREVTFFFFLFSPHFSAHAASAPPKYINESRICISGAGTRLGQVRLRKHPRSWPPQPALRARGGEPEALKESQK